MLMENGRTGAGGVAIGQTAIWAMIRVDRPLGLMAILHDGIRFPVNAGRPRALGVWRGRPWGLRGTRIVGKSVLYYGRRSRREGHGRGGTAMSAGTWRG
jgi:hypothetical protein